jgi:hypothetical protein
MCFPRDVCETSVANKVLPFYSCCCHSYSKHACAPVCTPVPFAAAKQRPAPAPAPKRPERPDVKGGTFTPASSLSFEGLVAGGFEWHAVFLQAFGFGETGVTSSPELLAVSDMIRCALRLSVSCMVVLWGL